MRLSKQLFQDRLQVPANWQDIQTYKLLESMGFVEFSLSGFPTFLPVGKLITNNICDVIREEAGRIGYSEVSLPLVQDRFLLESSGRTQPFADELMGLVGTLEGLVLSPTNEEVYNDLSARGVSSHRQ